MAPDLPISSDINQTGRRGVTLLQSCVERQGWLFRRQDDGGFDFGIDAEIEVVDRNRVTGRIAKCQIKSAAAVTFNNGEATVSVRVTTYDLWCATPLLPILFLVDTTKGGIYWTPALAHHPKSGSASLSVRFEELRDLKIGLSPLASINGSVLPRSRRM